MTAGLLFLTLFAQASFPSEEFRRGKVAFDRGEYAKAIDILRPLLYPDIRLETEGEIAQTHRILGQAHLFEKQPDLARQEFRRLLQLRPDYRFNPLLDPPVVVDFFSDVVREHEKELASLQARRQEAEDARERERQELERLRAGPAVVERKVVRNSYAVNFVPFGAGQFQNGQRSKGWAFLIAESAFAGISAAAFTTNLAVYGLRPKRQCNLPDPPNGFCPERFIDRTPEDTSKLLFRVQMASGVLFFATAAWGVLDALANFQPEVPIGPAAGTGGSAAVSNLRLAPVLLGSAVGPGLSFRF